MASWKHQVSNIDFPCALLAALIRHKFLSILSSKWVLINIPNKIPSSLISNRGCFQNFQNLYIFIFTSFHSSHLRSTFPKGIRLKSFQYEMRAIFTESLVHKT